MPNAKVKRVRERLERIKQLAAEMNAASRSTAITGSDLAEEAAGLGLELADILEEAK
jgi:hypothetical protein